MHSCAFEYSVRNSDLYDGVGGFSRTNADFIMFYQYLNNEDYVAYVPYGPEIEPSEDRQGEFLEIKYVGIDMNLPDSGRRYRNIVVFFIWSICFFSFPLLETLLRIHIITNNQNRANYYEKNSNDLCRSRISE